MGGGDVDALVWKTRLGRTPHLLCVSSQIRSIRT
jgi:hypothetical protein